MRSRIVLAVGCSAAALLAATAFSGQASARTAAGPLTRSTAPSHPAGPAKNPCYSQAGADTGTGILSTNTSDPAGYTSIGAADFTVKKSCTINLVVATGVYAAGSGPADDVTVTFYKAGKDGHPGKVVGSPQTVVEDGNSPVLSLPISKVVLKRGHYFVSVQANMDYNVKGGWYWETTATPLGNVDQWQNNGGAFSNCPTWQSLTTCFGFNYDFIVTLSKS